MTRTLLNCPAPAKLNLFLHVTGRREDGYHLLQSVFQLIDLGDTLHFTHRDDGVIRRTTAIEGVPEETDLIIRAAKLLQSSLYERNGKPLQGADIAVEKKLPMGGGLGGGSSDAATTFIALNKLWECGFTREELMALGAQLGADIPFFLFGSNALVEGIGEILTPIDTPDGWYVIIHPGISVPTSVIFQSEELTRNTEPIKMLDFASSYIKNGDFGKNDLQAVATKRFKEIAEAIQWLDNYASARMTGSGACVFARFLKEAEADKVIDALPLNWKGWKARAIPFHPLNLLIEK